MKFSLALVAGLSSLAVAQSISAPESASSTSTSLTPVQTCLAACIGGNVNCQAACLGLPYPGGGQANATTECSAQCPQGNGSQSDTQQYASCLAGCRGSYFLSSGTDFVGSSTASGAAATSSTGVASNSAAVTSSAASVSSKAASSATSTSTTSASTSSSSQGSAATVQIGAPFAGMAGILLAALAL